MYDILIYIYILNDSYEFHNMFNINIHRYKYKYVVDNYIVYSTDIVYNVYIYVIYNMSYCETFYLGCFVLIWVKTLTVKVMEWYDGRFGEWVYYPQETCMKTRETAYILCNNLAINMKRTKL